MENVISSASVCKQRTGIKEGAYSQIQSPAPTAMTPPTLLSAALLLLLLPGTLTKSELHTDS